jgi:hypothetical protein
MNRGDLGALEEWLGQWGFADRVGIVVM